MEKRDAGSAALSRGSFKILDASEQLDAFVTERGTEHAMRRKENGLEIARGNCASGRVFEKV